MPQNDASAYTVKLLFNLEAVNWPLPVGGRRAERPGASGRAVPGGVRVPLKIAAARCARASGTTEGVLYPHMKPAGGRPAAVGRG